MSSEWIEVSLDSLKASTKSAFSMGPFGSKIKAENFVSEGVPVIKGANLSHTYLDENKFDFLTPEKAQELASSKAYRLDIVVTHRGTLGQVGLIPENSKYDQYVVSQSQLKMSFDLQRVNPYFVYYFLLSPLGQSRLLANTSQVGVPAIAQALTTIRQVQIPLPSMRVQDEISSTLRTLDDRITLLRETNKTLEAIAQTIFKSWFVDFDPVKAKMDGRLPAGMDEETAALFPVELVESELGLIPKGWEVGTLRQMAELNPEVWSTKKYPPELLYVDLANAKDNELASLVSYKFDEAPSRARRVLRCGDTIIGTVRPGNRSYALIKNPLENLTGSTGFAVLRPKESKFTEYIFLAATQESSIEHFAHLADGAAYPAIRPDVVINLSCALPPSAVMISFHNITSPMLAKVAYGQKTIQALVELRDTLLPRLISGKLRVPIDETESSEA